ncbi:MAG: hypothetical protein GY813_07230 [Halieaceae bacterium]|nr:hypothetical protein [Halieaceae bacterium]
MKYTNNHDLPNWVYTALTNSRYQRGAKPSDISVTRLIDSPLIRKLTEEHGEDITEEAINQVYSTLGSGVHYWFELAGEKCPIKTEERLYSDWKGRTLSGQYDVYCDEQLLWDVKVTSAWTIVRGEPKWSYQLNVLAWLARQNGMDVKGLRILAVLRDWQRTKAREPNYPSFPLQIVNIPLWDNEKCERYINNRMHQHFESSVSTCSPSERWQTETTYAVKKDGNKRALKVCDTVEKAGEFIEGHKDGKKLYVETRTGTARRCADYCSVNQWCPVFSNMGAS